MSLGKRFSGRWRNALSSYPMRLYRVFRHLFFWRAVVGLRIPEGPYKAPLPFVNPLILWCLCLALYLLDLIFLPELYETLYDILKRKSRGLNEKELALAQSVFGKSITWSRVCINPEASIISKRRGIVFVSFYTINCWGDNMPDSLLMHELVHVWQFQRFGSVYILYAWLAQASAAGYNYGGINAITQETNLLQYNFEQQADILTDYIRIQQGAYPWWTPIGTDSKIYEPLVKQLNV